MAGAQPGASNVLVGAGLALLSLACLDTGIFRSGLYDLVVASDSSVGAAARAVRTARPEAGRLVAVVGDSRAAEAFSVSNFDAAMGDDGLRGLNFAMPGSTLRVWSLLLETIDPNRDRFRYVVVPLGEYGGRSFALSDPANRLDDLSFLGPIQSLSQTLALVDSYSNSTGRQHAWLTSIFKSFAYRHDVRDLLSDPLPRTRGRWRIYQGHNASLAYRGRPETMAGVRIDGQRIVGFPEVIPSWRRRQLARFVFHTATAAEVAERVRDRDRYRTRWLGRICRRYAGTGTRIVILHLPPTVLPAVDSHGPVAPAKNLQALVDLSHVYLAPTDLTSDLQAPEFFCDTTHLNQVGRKQWTTRLAEYLRGLAD